jgi:hypothetical protein
MNLRKKAVNLGNDVIVVRLPDGRRAHPRIVTTLSARLPVRYAEAARRSWPSDLGSESPQERQRALSHGVVVMFSLGTDGKCPPLGAGGDSLSPGGHHGTWRSSFDVQRQLRFRFHRRATDPTIRFVR